LFDTLSKAKGITIKTELTDELQVYMDRNHLGLILRNLISNAIKFSRPDGAIIIKTVFHSGKVSLSVQDFGVGMKPEDVTKLFTSKDHFSKPGTQKEKGTGLGLMLVKEFVDKSNSTIRVESEEGSGSLFTLQMEGRIRVS
jgi:signal transduction histidine kinase